MNIESLLKQRLICVAVIDQPDDAVPLAEALLAGGLSVMEVTFRTSTAADSIARIRKSLPAVAIGAGTLLVGGTGAARRGRRARNSAFRPGLNEAVLATAQKNKIPFFPGVMTPTETGRALDLGWKHLKFFPAEAAGGVAMLKALAGPFAHTGVKFVPTGGINAANLPDYLALPQVAAIGGSWMAERKLVTEKAWSKITALTAEAMKIIAQAQTKA